MQPANTFYSVVVLGAMDPRLHHPAWYRAIGLFSEDQYKEALENPSSVCTPMVAHLATKEISVVCQQERWEVQTTDSQRTNELCKMAAQLFDADLIHTPIRAYGFNFNLGFRTERGLLRRIMQPLKATGLEADWENLITGSFRIATEQRGAKVVRDVAVGDDRSVTVSNNYHYEVKPATSPGELEMFELRPLFDEHYSHNREDALNASIEYVDTLTKN